MGEFGASNQRAYKVTGVFIIEPSKNKHFSINLFLLTSQGFVPNGKLKQ